MNRTSVIGMLGLVLVFCMSGFAAPPIPIKTVASITDLELEVGTQVAALEKLLADAATYEKNSPAVRQAFGVLACVGQGVADHEDVATATVQGAALRDSALMYQRTSTFAEAQAALAAVQLAQAGTSTLQAVQEFPWNKLINMHPMMEELNSRHADLIKVLKRPRGKAEEPVHATTSALLAIAMLADTHEVKNEADIPKWNEWATAYREQMLQVASAIRAKDGVAGREWLEKANKSCTDCHAAFRNE